mgnify:CR=1 FL=1
MSIDDGGIHGGTTGGAREMMFKLNQCSPASKHTDVKGSCLDNELLIEILKALNKMSKKNKKIHPISTNNKSKEALHAAICENIARISKCSSEACWMTIRSLMKNLGAGATTEFKSSFKPLMPKKWLKDYNEWLTTFDIEDCLNQHAEADHTFFFYGAVPNDFSKCSVSELCSFDLKKHKDAGETKIGIVFNTDPSHEDGHHWIAMWIDLNGANSKEWGPAIYYFDSFGEMPSSEVQAFIQKTIQQGEKCKIDFAYFVNDICHQKGDSQCGMYTIDFIKRMLEGIQFEDYLRMGINDKQMIKLRKKYFISPNEL